MNEFKVLVADDDVKIRTTLKVLLKKKFQIVPETAKSGKEALEKINENNGNYDLIITDNHMGEISGLDVIEYTNKKYPEIDIVLMTAAADHQISIPKIKNVILEFLEKPFENDDFEKVVQKFLDKTEAEENTKKLVELGQMSSAIIHEINNPLAVLTFKSFALQEAVEHGKMEKSKEVEEGLESMQKNINQLSAIISATKAAYSKNNEKTFRPFTVKEMVKDLIDYYGVKFKSFVKIQIADEFLDLQINGNKDQITQCVYNLMKNAQQEVIKQENPWVKLTVDLAQNGAVVVSVIDSGTGIPIELHSKLFSPFYTSKNAGEGTGLGLSIVKRIVESHTGVLMIDINNPNTKFDITLPLIKKETPEEGSVAA